MTPLDKMRAWIATYPEFDILANGFHVDYTDQVPANGGIFPSGLVEIERRRDITGNAVVTNQYNFGLYYVFEKAPGDDIGAAVNADWVIDFQTWVQEQSVLGLAPTFGDEPHSEKIMAQNGVMYAADEEGTATYMVQLSATYNKKYKGENKWLI